MGNLVLTRRRDEEIIIGNNQIIIKVLRLNSNQVSLSINAPSSLSVHRKEIFERVAQEENVKRFPSSKVRVHYKNGNRIDKR
jgi:carbon storage regulator CsrA